MSASTSTHTFQAEVGQLLDIVTHSLYTDKEIFLRELVSNAADALEKLRHLQLTEKSVADENLPLEINLTTDDQAGTVTVQDFGIGMTREELVENIGTIAHSGSKAFLQALRSSQEQGGEAGTAGLNLIGQFGVGFYSAFMVAEEVSLYTRTWRPEGEHLVWRSQGRGSYEIETSEGQRRGCKIVLKLKPEEKEFSRDHRVKGILQKYSRFVPFPINLNGERINTVQALWLKNKNEIKDEEYVEFYKYQANAFDEPQRWLHFTADAPLSIHALLFLPKENPERYGFGRVDPGVALYCKKILIDPKPTKLLPEWLRFVRGVVDSADLPLNISRESMQDSALMGKLHRVLTGRLLKFLEEEAEKRPEAYETFYRQFATFLKEGIATDFGNREKLAKLLRYETSLTESGKTTSLAEVVQRAKEDAKELFYLVGPNREALEKNPSLESFRARQIEVLFLYDVADEFVMHQLGQFDGRTLRAADASDLALEDVTGDQGGEPLPREDAEALCQWVKENLGERVAAVRPSKRLVASPAVALNADRVLTPAMRRLLKGMQRDSGETNTIDLELNTRHPLVHNLQRLRGGDPDLARLVAGQLCDNAFIAAGFLEDPRAMLERLNQLLTRVSGAPLPPADPPQA